MRVYNSLGQPKGPKSKRSGLTLPALAYNSGYRTAGETFPGPEAGTRGIPHPAIHFLPPHAAPPADPPGMAWGEPGPRGEPGQPRPPSYRVPAAARGGNFLPGRLRTGPWRATSGLTRGREGTAAVPPPRVHRGPRQVPGWVRDKPRLGTEPRHGAGEGGESPLFFLGAEYCANSGKWDFSPPALQPQCRDERGWREARGAQTYQA